MNAFEKSYPRDNTFCSFDHKRVEFIIRGGNKYSEPKENGYGEFIFYRNAGKKAKLLAFNHLRSDTYTFFKGRSPLCSKSHGYKINDSTIAILLKLENRPFPDKLVLQLFDYKTLSPKALIETQYAVESAELSTDGFIFKSIPENHNPDFGKVSIEGYDFIFQEKDFPTWINYSGQGFELNKVVTFSKFPWKRSFKDQADFDQATGWNSLQKKFTKTITYVAVNHKLKKRCLLLIQSKQELAGNESWRCHAI